MISGPFLNKQGEDEWLRVKQYLEWSDHFALGFIFTDNPGIVKIFRERFADIYRARITRMEIPSPEKPSLLFDGLLPELLDPPVHLQALKAPYWVDLTRQKGEEWTTARLNFLMRLNEHRETLRKALKRPLVLVLPVEERDLIKKLVPDLWSIRDFSLVTGPWLETGTSPPPARPSDQGNSVLSMSSYEKFLVDVWQKLKKEDNASRGFLFAGELAFDVCLKTGHYELATEIAQTMTDSARKIIDSVGETPESLRDLSVSLNKVGDTAKAMGKWDKAQKSFEESLKISRKIIDSVGETPESLRDLSVSLDKMGALALGLEDYEKAKNFFGLALTIAAPLSEAFPHLSDYKNLKDHFLNRLKELDKQKFHK